MTDSFGARSTFSVGGQDYEIYRLDAVKDGHVERLPYSLKIIFGTLELGALIFSLHQSGKKSGSAGGAFQ